MFPPDEQNFAQKDLKVQQRVTVKNTILYLVEAAASDFRPRLGKGRTLETAKFLKNNASFVYLVVRHLVEINLRFFDKTKPTSGSIKSQYRGRFEKFFAC